jgi:CheY-like chemotaxis protein
MRVKPSGGSSTHLRAGRVLIIDDEPFLGEALRLALGGDHHIEFVAEASEALARLQRGEHYDVVLCDLMMPSMDGIEFHRRLSEARPEEAARVVFITGGAITARVESFFNRVPNVLLEKPVDLDGLRGLIERRVRGVETMGRSMPVRL